MNTRRLAPLALVGALLLGTTGCTFVTDQATLTEYNPGDGVGFSVGDLKVRDALIIADEQGALGNFSAAVINDADRSQTLTLTWDGGSADIDVNAGQTLTLGFDGDEPKLLEDLGTPPGALASIEFSDGSQSTLATIPVLDGGLEHYRDLVPDEADADD